MWLHEATANKLLDVKMRGDGNESRRRAKEVLPWLIESLAVSPENPARKMVARRLLSTELKQCKDAKRRFAVVGNARVVQTVKLVRLEDFLHLKEDLDKAIAPFAS